MDRFSSIILRVMGEESTALLQIAERIIPPWAEMQKAWPTRKVLSKRKLLRLQKIEKGSSNHPQMHTSLLKKEKSSQFLVSTVDRSHNGLTLQYRAFSGEESNAQTAWGLSCTSGLWNQTSPNLLGIMHALIILGWIWSQWHPEDTARPIFYGCLIPNGLWPPPQSSVAIVVLFVEKQQLFLPWPFLPEQYPFILSSWESHRAQHVFATLCE